MLLTLPVIPLEVVVGAMVVVELVNMAAVVVLVVVCTYLSVAFWSIDFAFKYSLGVPT